MRCDVMRCWGGQRAGERGKGEKEGSEEGGLGMASVLYHQPPPGTHGVGEGGAQGGASKAVAVSLSQARFTARSPSHQVSGDQLALGHRQAGNAATKTWAGPYSERDPRTSRSLARVSVGPSFCGVGGEYDGRVT